MNKSKQKRQPAPKWNEITYQSMKRDCMTRRRRFRIHIGEVKWEMKMKDILFKVKVFFFAAAISPTRRRLCCLLASPWDPLWITFHSIEDHRLVYDAATVVVVARLIAFLSCFPVNNYVCTSWCVSLLQLHCWLPFRRTSWASHIAADETWLWVTATRHRESMMYLLFSLLLSSHGVEAVSGLMKEEEDGREREKNVE